MILIGYLRAIWRFRNFITASIRGEFFGRFASSRIGAAWHILHPLALAAIYSLVLSQILGARLPGVTSESAFPIFLIAGIASWSIFSEIVSRSMTVFIEFGGTMKKISFPRIALPVIVFGSALINHLLLLIAASVVFIFFGHYPSITWLALPIGIVIAASFAFGLGILLGVLNVFLRDVGQFMTVVLQLWFWLTPIVYPANILPPGMQKIIAHNPMTPVVGLYQDVLLRHQWPDLSLLIYPLSLAIGMLIISLLVFNRASAELTDAL